jgi:hypothetical protein
MHPMHNHDESDNDQQQQQKQHQLDVNKWLESNDPDRSK